MSLSCSECVYRGYPCPDHHFQVNHLLLRKKVRYTKPFREDWNLGVGLVNRQSGMSFNPFNVGAIASRVGLLFFFFIVIPILAGLAITVLQSVFPWWPRS